VIERIRTGGAPGGLRIAGGSVWVGSGIGNSVFRINPNDNSFQAVYVGDSPAVWIDATDSAVWAMHGTENTVTRVDPSTNKAIDSIKVGAQPVDGVTGPDGRVWIPDLNDNTVSVIDPATDTVAETVPVGQGPFVLRQAFGDLWVSSYKGTDIWRIHP
jgi:YVTN family beta-propeller protein